MKKSRRNFLKFAALATVSTVACPHKFLGEESIETRVSGDEISGIIRFSFEKYPMLRDDWGSVRIKIDFPGEPAYPSIIVSNYPESEKDCKFTCVSERCPHEGYPVFDLHPIFHDFECSGHFTRFNIEGEYITGPASADLDRYELFCKDGDEAVYVVIPGYPYTSVEREENLTYMKTPSPNPAKGTARIEFGVEKPATTKILIYDLSGNVIATPIHAYLSGAELFCEIDVSTFTPGAYVAVLSVNGEAKNRRKFIVER